ncbi:hypothetical protein [Sodalis sp.]
MSKNTSTARTPFKAESPANADLGNNDAGDGQFDQAHAVIQS